MKEKEVEKLIEREVLKAKVITQDKTIRFLLWFFGVLLTVFGVVIPLWWSNRLSDKVDEAISETKREMKEVQIQYEQKNIYNERNFKETAREISSQQNSTLLAISNNADKILKETKEQVQSLIGQQFAKPEITLLYDGEELNGKTIDITGKEGWSSKFEIYNKGKATAKNFKMFLYLKKDSKLDNIGWTTRTISEEKEFSISYLYNKKLDIIFPSDRYPLEANFYFGEGVKSVKEELLVRIISDEVLAPTKISFCLEIKSKIKE